MKMSILALFYFVLTSTQAFTCEIIDAKIYASVTSGNAVTLQKNQIIRIKVKQDFTTIFDMLSFAGEIASRYSDPKKIQHVDIWFINSDDVEAGTFDSHHTHARFNPREDIIKIEHSTIDGKITNLEVDSSAYISIGQNSSKLCKNRATLD